MQNNQYAIALFDISKENNKLEECYSSFSLFMKLLEEDNDLKKIVESPKIKIEEKKKIIKEILKDNYEDFIFFLFVVLDNNRITELEDIYNSFVNLYNENYKIKVVKIISSIELDNEETKKITQCLKRIYPSYQFQINNEVKQDMIAGYSIYVDGKCLDLSIKKQLDLIKSSI